MLTGINPWIQCPRHSSSAGGRPGGAAFEVESLVKEPIDGTERPAVEGKRQPLAHGRPITSGAVMRGACRFRRLKSSRAAMLFA